MRVRYVSNNRARVRVFTNDVSILTLLHRRLVSEGFQQVSFVKFWVHVITAGKRGFQGNSQTDESNTPGVNPDDSAEI